MDTATNSAPSSGPTTTRSCQRCAARKIRCDKQQPCRACVRHNVECEYRTLPPPRRKKKPDRNEILISRLEQYEKLLHQKGVDPGALPKAPSHHTSSLTTKRSGLTAKDTSPLPISDPTIVQPLGVIPQTQLIHDKNRSKYLDNGLWTRVVEELAEPVDVLGHSSDEDGDEDDAAQDNIDFVLGLTPTSISIDSSHPPGDQILELWQVFLENVDPLTKVVHGPSLQPAIQKAIFDLSSVPKSLEALLFAIYSAAVVSLKNHDCERRFGESRKALLSRYRLATRAALSRANFTGSANLAVLQAFLIHLLSMREVYDSRTLWTLTGVALRIAEGMGLHRDGSVLGLPPFETEIRRRVWWQLKLLDGDSAELSGSDKIGSFCTDPRNPKFPSNINDDELYPGLSSLPVTTDRATDMIYCALRFELRGYWPANNDKQRQQGKDDCLWDSYGSSAVMNERDKALDEFENILETKYVRYCDPSQPIQFMTILIARAAVSTARLIAHHPRRWVSENIPESERHYVWNLSIKGLKQYNMILSNRELERFSWHAAFYFRCWAFIHVLDTLRVDPLMQEADQVWHIIDEVYETNPDFATNTKKALYIAVGVLCLKAYNAREAALAKDGKPIPPTPSYIKSFRKQREAANARRKNRGAAVKNTEHPVEGFPIVTQSMSTDKRYTPRLIRRPQEQPLHLPQPRQTLPPQLTGSHQPELPGGSSALWLSDRSDKQSDGLFTFTDDNANMDPDMLLALDDSMVNPINQTIDWVKWDALLSDFT